MAHDVVIRGGNVVDGTGAEPYQADVAIDGDRISEIGVVNEQGREENLYSYLTVRRGILDQRAWLQWAEEVRQALEHASVGLPTS